MSCNMLDQIRRSITAKRTFRVKKPFVCNEDFQNPKNRNEIFNYSYCIILFSMSEGKEQKNILYIKNGSIIMRQTSTEINPRSNLKIETVDE